LTLLAGVALPGLLATASNEVRAQTRPEVGRGAEAGGSSPRGEPRDRSPGPQRPDEQAPSENSGSSMQDGPPTAPGCPDQRRRLELIV
jgi:hypothetical protein